MEISRLIDETLLEESLEDLYENAPSGYISTLPDGTFVKVNQTFLNWTGYSRDELLGHKRFQDLLTIQGKIYHDTHLDPLLHMQGFVNEVAFDLMCRGDRKLPILINLVQKRDDSGKPFLNRITVFNATDRRKYEQELLRARKRAEAAAEAKSRLLSTISHEIQTPLASILMMLRLLEQSGLTPDQVEYIEILRSSADLLQALVTDILDYSRIEAGRVTLEEKNFSLRALVNEIRNQLKSKAREKGLEIQLVIDEQLPEYLVGDPLKIGQVITNLMSNAVKFTEAGFVRLDVSVGEMLPDQVAVTVSVTDTGIGIPPDRVAYIFDEFTQASPEIALTYGGTGLGLAISRKLLKLYNSEIVVDSEPGKGSTFAFTLPLKKGRPAD